MPVHDILNIALDLSDALTRAHRLHTRACRRRYHHAPPRLARCTLRPVQEDVTLREERIDVRRERVDEPISPEAMDSTLTEDEFVVTAKGEEAVVGKEARVVERVHVGKTADTRTERIEETERRRDVEVEEIEEDIRDRPRRP